MQLNQAKAFGSEIRSKITKPNRGGRRCFSVLNSVETQEFLSVWGNLSGGLVCVTTLKFLLTWYGCLGLHIVFVYCLFIVCLLEVT